ncbi:hypothetical protein [Clostridium sp. FP1]|uniref:hypothetical protein n=1 Tax=Clostridium sp. FP1 TaxID=2724076 RepID=UPI0013E8FC1A|nr:hypothetical protein [Clostridium sp. FP1]MBZ9635531.1 hypothetical protein [Clostridium sp. FP1]
MKELTLGDLDKLDVIEVTEDELDKIKNWCLKNNDLINRNVNLINIIFNKGLIKRNVSNNIYFIIYFEFVNEKLRFSNYAYNSIVRVIKPTIGVTKPIITLKNGIKMIQDKIFITDLEDTDISLSEFYLSHSISSDEHLEEINITLCNFFSILIYSQLNQEQVIRQTKTHTHKIQSKKDKRAGKKPKTKLIKQTIITLNTDHIQPPTEEEKREYERHTLGWTVRGHWREYKSGKKVWIKPHINGDKDNVEGKVYEV